MSIPPQLPLPTHTHTLHLSLCLQQSYHNHLKDSKSNTTTCDYLYVGGCAQSVRYAEIPGPHHSSSTICYHQPTGKLAAQGGGAGCYAKLTSVRPQTLSLMSGRIHYLTLVACLSNQN